MSRRLHPVRFDSRPPRGERSYKHPERAPKARPRKPAQTTSIRPRWLDAIVERAVAEREADLKLFINGKLVGEATSISYGTSRAEGSEAKVTFEQLRKEWLAFRSRCDRLPLYELGGFALKAFHFVIRNIGLVPAGEGLNGVIVIAEVHERDSGERITIHGGTGRGLTHAELGDTETVAKEVRAAILRMVEHELDEQIWIDGARRDPHAGEA